MITLLKGFHCGKTFVTYKVHSQQSSLREEFVPVPLTVCYAGMAISHTKINKIPCCIMIAL